MHSKFLCTVGMGGASKVHKPETGAGTRTDGCDGRYVGRLIRRRKGGYRERNSAKRDSKGIVPEDFFQLGSLV